MREVSRAYRIRVVESEKRYITAGDRVCTDIELLPILPQERLAQILGEELAGRGFEVADGVAKRTDGEVELEVDLASGRVSARLEAGADVERTAESTVTSQATRLSSDRDEAVRKKLRAQLDENIAEAQKALQEEVTAKLEAKLRDVQHEVDEVSNRVAGAALKEKAAQLGEILELSEDESGSLTIKVKV